MLTVQFDRLLNPGPVTMSTWSARFNNNLYWSTGAGSVLGAVASVAMAVGLPDAGPDVCHYTAIPPDVISTYGVPAAPFSNFPIT